MTVSTLPNPTVYLIEQNEKTLNGKIENLKEYDELESFDFGKFDKIVRKFKREYFNTEEEFKDYKRWLLQIVSKGIAEHPLLTVSKGSYSIISGRMRMLAMKVLGISPLFRVIEVG